MNPDVSAQAPSRTSEQGLALLVERLTARLQAGEVVDLAALAREHPEHAPELERMLPALEALAELGGSAPPARPAAGAAQTLGDFRLLREVGRGGMGVVYEA